jgi:Holliday junction resolvasome RuvABC endonuclease subunit
VNNVQTFKTLAEVFGVISELLVEMKIPQSAVLASSWKSVLSIRGRARAEQKRAAQEWVVANYSVRPTQDECDAICIGAHVYKKSPIGADDDCAWAE